MVRGRVLPGGTAEGPGMTRWEIFYLVLVVGAFGGFFATVFINSARFDRQRRGRPVIQREGDPREPYHGGKPPS